MLFTEGNGTMEAIDKFLFPPYLDEPIAPQGDDLNGMMWLLIKE
ncbi:hypothetical protein MMC2321_03086 [Chitinophaga sp. MM2321]